MAISPIDIRMIQNINEVTQIKHNEMTRPEAQQAAITREVQKDANERLEQVVQKEDADKSNTEHDAREKGKNEYFANGNKRKKKEESGKLTVKSNSSFDMKI